MSSLDAGIRRVASRALIAVGLRQSGPQPRARHVFSDEAPNAQATVDIFAGEWVSAFPEELGVTAGWINHFDPQVDPRVAWVDGELPDGLSGMSVLELGPFEAYQSALLERAGVASVLAVEGSQTAFLKCLVVKELLGLQAHYLYGDVQRFLEQDEQRYDIVWASGILYHQPDPIGLLERIAEHTDRVFLHTHYVDPTQPLAESPASRMNPSQDVYQRWHDRDIHLHRYEYADDTRTDRFAGGPREYALWMEKDDIEFVLSELGLSQISHGVVDPINPNGAGMFLLATRP